MRKDLDLELLGKVAQLQPDGTPLQLHARGEHAGRAFSVVGRVQMRYAQGFWNEWHLRFDDEGSGWLGEAQGFYSVSFPVEPCPPLPAYEKLAVGSEVKLPEGLYEVRDKHEAQYVSAEGELPYQVPLGETASFADLSGPEGQFATVDYSEQTPALFSGRHATFDELKFSGLKAIEGW